MIRFSARGANATLDTLRPLLLDLVDGDSGPMVLHTLVAQNRRRTEQWFERTGPYKAVLRFDANEQSPKPGGHCGRCASSECVQLYRFDLASCAMPSWACENRELLGPQRAARRPAHPPGSTYNTRQASQQPPKSRTGLLCRICERTPHSQQKMNKLRASSHVTGQK